MQCAGKREFHFRMRAFACVRGKYFFPSSRFPRYGFHFLKLNISHCAESAVSRAYANATEDDNNDVLSSFAQIKKENPRSGIYIVIIVAKRFVESHVS